MNPLVSILLPVYNGGRFLRETIDSILSQSYLNFELIIINDGSTDNSEEIILSYKDTRIRYYRNKENIRLIETLNKGILLSKGKYIARIDSDDIMRCDRISKQVTFLELKSDYVLVGSHVSLIRDGKNHQNDSIEYYTENDDLVFSMIYYCPFIHPSVLIKAETLIENKLLFSDEFLHAEDYELWTRIIRYGKVANIPEKLTSYRIHPEQISSVNLEFQKEQMRKIQEIYLREMLPEFTDFEKKVLFNNFKIDLNIKELFDILRRFELNKSFIGDAKKRFINKLAKQKILEIEKINLSDLLYVISSQFYKSNSITFKQKIAFFLKIFKH